MRVRFVFNNKKLETRTPLSKWVDNSNISVESNIIVQIYYTFYLLIEERKIEKKMFIFVLKVQG